MNPKHALSGAALLVAAVVAFPAFAQRSTPISAPPARYSLLGGTTVPNGVDVVSAEVGWPSATFGLTHGMSSTTDIGFKFDLIWGFEDTTIGQFGLGFRVPLRSNILRRDRFTALVHIDPGIKVYTTSPANFGIQFPVGATLAYAAAPEWNVGFGVELPMTLMVTPSPVRFFLGPLFGPEIEYHVDRQLTVGLNSRFGPVFNTNSGASEFGLIMQALLAYRL
ncbi:MAG TPA: hypothetical protein VG496_03935 [Myxococcales bacterium]|nr:hypothetical protein [Myxococcales bacterium]